MKNFISKAAAAAVALILCVTLSACDSLAKTVYETTVIQQTVDVEALYSLYLEENPEADFDEFLALLDVNYSYTEYAADKGIKSAVSIYTSYTVMTYDRWGRPTTAETGAAGSGVIYRIDGGDVYIITNYHVLYDNTNIDEDNIADSIEIYTYNNENEDSAIAAEFVGGDLEKDIAVIKAKETDFKSEIKAVTAAEDLLKLGSTVVAIGNPLAEGIAVTAGVVSVLSEDIEMEALDDANDTVIMTVIRTDAAINSGNSGGGLYNSKGELVGIVNAKTVQSGVESMGYAIPVNVVIAIANDVLGI